MGRTNCHYEGCLKRIVGKRIAVGMCADHDPAKRICLFTDCDRRIKADNKHGYCFKHTGSSPTVIAMKREHHEANRDRYREKNREWGNANKAKRKEITEEWCRNNPERVRELRRKREQVRRARKKDAFVEVVDPTYLWRRDSGLCFLCGFPCDKEAWEMAHIVPLSRGGEHSYMNLAVSHPYCNGKQFNSLLDEEFNPDILWEDFMEEVN